MPALQSPDGSKSTGLDTDPLIGRLINDRYKIVEQIGHGGMGRVYKALQSPLDRVIALKVLGGGHDRDPNFYKRFALEASVTAKLTHPNTITLYDYGRTDDGVFFIAMEYLAGRTLSQTMQADGPLAQERVIHIAQQICRSLREAHALGIIHRDLKPANVILLRQHDDHDFVKVLDFGLVKFFSGDNPDNDITNAGTFMGSPHYIAPEQARNQSPDQRCDIYSLGVLLYHMLTGKVPFTAAAPVDIILKHLHEDPVPLRTLRPDLNLSPELEGVVLKCMQKKREDRFQSMDDLLNSLKIVRTQITGVSGPHSMPPGFTADTQDGMRPVSPLHAATPSAAWRTPSQPMPAMRTPAAGLAHVSGAPPPPPDDALEELEPISQTAVTPGPMKRLPSTVPSFGGIVDQRNSAFRPAVLLPVALGVAAIIGVAFYLRGSAQAQAQADAAVAAATSAPITTSASDVPPVGVTAAAPVVPTTYQTANAGTTLINLTSIPSGAEVHDADDRLLGMTPFDLRVPSSKEMKLTLKRDGFKAVTLKKTPTGPQMPISVTLKKDPKADETPGTNKRTIGTYKDDPY